MLFYNPRLEMALYITPASLSLDHAPALLIRQKTAFSALFLGDSVGENYFLND
jgi:hypothetical protein